ncbi:MAG: lipid-A-disaccharide synthase N-terminal domain-containing protein [Shimia sp.]
MDEWLSYFGVETRADALWLGFGLIAQTMFFMRFFVQWLASEKKRMSVIPNAFWWFSLAGGIMLFVYGIERGEPVIILGQSIGILIYIRNLWFIYGQRT